MKLRTHTKWYWPYVYVALCLLGLFLVSYILSKLLSYLADLYIDNMRAAVYWIGIEKAYWVLVAELFATYAGIALAALTVQLFTREYFEYFKQYINSLARFNDEYLSNLATVFIIIVGFIATIAGLTTYAQFTEKEIVINRFWRLYEEHYTYQDVKSIRVVSYWIETEYDDPSIEKIYYVINFNNGKPWRPEMGVSFVKGKMPSLHWDIIEFVSQRSGQDIQYVQRDKPG